jgi:hypothetical protein
MAKRTLSETVDPYIDALREVHNDKRTMKDGKRVLSVLIRDLSGMALIVDKILRDHGVQPRRRMGRHARADEREEQQWFDLDCYMTTLQLHDIDGMTWTAAFERAAEELRVAPETVRKAHSRGKKALASRR